ncbi:MAG: hormogonium polysaccharide biosynthesis protein HpsA [Cyanobacteriota bacterium]|nr:hormogonium polysaccharide biosynthesis protein HpsA [Cyanobacteriota bacterium]
MSKFRRTAQSFIQTIPRLLRRLGRRISYAIQTLRRWAFQRLLRRGRQSSRATAGFILPTAVMVILVVSLLTTAIVIRSTDRAKNASNYRINQVTLNASLPAIERAKAKIDKAFGDPNLPRGTPSNLAIDDVLGRNAYRLPDEAALQVQFDDGTDDDGDNRDLDALNTAWRFPVDTDNNGRYDSLTLYGIYFRGPRQQGTGFERERSPLDARTPPQDDSATGNFCEAAVGTSAALIGTDGWYKTGSKLKKSFYVYTATVPITDLNELGFKQSDYETFQGNQGFTALEYQQDRARIPLGNNAVVYQNDLDLFSGPELRINGRIITNGNLLAAENSDLFLYQVSSPTSCFYEEENSKILVGGNVGNGFVGSEQNTGVIDVHLFQGKGEPIKNAKSTNPKSAISPSNVTVSQNPSQLAYNDQAYEQRIELLINSALKKNGNQTIGGTYPNQTVSSNDPEQIQDKVRERINADVPDDPEEARRSELETWFRNRTRRVPYNEVAAGGNALGTFTIDNAVEDATKDTLRPKDQWIYIENDKLNRNNGQLPATEPDEQEAANKENLGGDRILVGNGLPPRWYDKAASDFANEDSTQPVGSNTKWNLPSGTDEIRTRQSRVQELVDVGLTERDGFWEKAATETPENRLDGVGGLRLVTGAGLYLTEDYHNANLLPKYTGGTVNNDYNASLVVWPDTMPTLDTPAAAGPQSVGPDQPVPAALSWLPDRYIGNIDNDGDLDYPLDEGTGRATNPVRRPRPFLRMRATAVYHYTHKEGKEPLACVSSFYDPTNWKSAQNRQGLTDTAGTPKPKNSGEFAQEPAKFTNRNNNSDGVNSNNGIVYNFTGTAGASMGTVNDPLLKYEARLVYPNGRLVNPRLAKAVNTPKADRTLADNAAIDSTLCASQIFKNPTAGVTTAPNGFKLPHGTIQEVAFLDSREVRDLEWDDPDNLADEDYDEQPKTVADLKTELLEKISEYDLPIELRQPLEIRATAIDLDVLRRQTAKTVGTGPQTEWMLPDSGIIYATRDDGLPDASAREVNTPTGKRDYEHELKHELELDGVSATDFWLDPTRRPNAIVLFNGEKLGRNNKNQFDNGEEKGLILATNLPTYIKGDFNLHQGGGKLREEFDQQISDDFQWKQFYNRDAQGGSGLDDQFACRPGDNRLPACTTGDEWRAVAVLSDTLTLLSNEFRFGFRNEGDYDLRNNQTDNQFRKSDLTTAVAPNWLTSAVLDNAVLPPGDIEKPEISIISDDPEIDTVRRKRLNNGFWDNTFLTNALSSNNNSGAFCNNTACLTTPNTKFSDVSGQPGGTQGYSDAPAANAPLYSTYFNNFITPVQRRNREFSEYVMEICRKLPVSECKPDDWVIGGYDANNNNTVSPGNTLPNEAAIDENAFLGAPVDLNQDGTITSPAAVDLNGNGVTTDTNLKETELQIPTWAIAKAVEAGANINIARLGSGTTATAPSDPADQQYPRRVAFVRNEHNQLMLSEKGTNSTNDENSNLQVTPIPLGANASNEVAKFEYAAGSNPTPNGNANQVPKKAANALWFRTSKNPNEPTKEADIHYAHNKWLYYDPPKNEMYEVLLPDVLNFKDSELTGSEGNKLKTAYQQFNGYAPSTLGSQTTNGSAKSPADYSLCLGGGTDRTSQFYEVNEASAEPGVCPALAGSRNAATQLKNLTVTAANKIPLATLNSTSLATTMAFPRKKGDEFPLEPPAVSNVGVDDAPIPNLNTVNKKVYVYDISGTLGTPVTIKGTIALEADPDAEETFFVFKANYVTFDQVTLKLENGADPNNVFWVADAGDITFDLQNGPSVLAGNFMGTSTPVVAILEDGASPSVLTLNGSRLLGFSGTTNLDFDALVSKIDFTAITTQNQPLLVPVLQIHVPKANTLDASGPNKTNIRKENGEKTHWLPQVPKANDTTYNLAIVAGDSPARYLPKVPFKDTAIKLSGEFNGALSNLPRFLENWSPDSSQAGQNLRTPVKIQGSFLQLKRSSYNTAPYWSILVADKDTDNAATERNSFFNYPQRYKFNVARNQTYEPPQRLWGYDVGLLSQLPDLFSRRFTLPPTDDPNEYYREVSRNDDWVQTLLCSEAIDPKTGRPAKKAVNNDERPTDFCTKNTKQ